MVSIVVLTLKSLLHVDRLLSTGLEVRDPSMGLAEGHCPLRSDLDIGLVLHSL
jgi:hypothetical protein